MLMRNPGTHDETATVTIVFAIHYAGHGIAVGLGVQYWGKDHQLKNEQGAGYRNPDCSLDSVFSN